MGGAPGSSPPAGGLPVGQRIATTGPVFPSVSSVAFTAGLAAAVFAAAATAARRLTRRRHGLPQTGVPAGTTPAGAEPENAVSGTTSMKGHR
ncbi:hypothetical protein ACFV2N_39015 [Streptomyces sp. NPDC059680]|uniref:hypothetical protein n=1 Tax=Streptomyces TaxID=1883 RepID=UPI001E28F3BE|nr:hypothetical protein [Streptomyces barringtoniae]MCC5481036.1 hypothetical protein [Streptomyces barringtoniae]